MSQTDFEFSINISKTLEKAKCQVSRFLHFREKKSVTTTFISSKHHFKRSKFPNSVILHKGFES